MKISNKFLSVAFGLIVVTVILLIIKKSLPTCENILEMENCFWFLEVAAVSLLFISFSLGHVISLFRSVFKTRGQQNVYEGLTWREIGLVFTTLGGSYFMWLAFSKLLRLVEK
jgi:hypothetical protein